MAEEQERGMLARCPLDPEHELTRRGPMLDGSITVRCTQDDSLNDGRADVAPWRPRPRLMVMDVS